MRVLLLVMVALAACADEVAITDGTCGNWVLDPGEDCDRPGTSCTPACRISCSPTARGTPCAAADAIDGTCCPSGFTCGLDQVCHAPAGTIQTSEVVEPFDVTSYAVGDLDGDLVDDLLGVNSGSVLARYGAEQSPLSTVAIQNAPFSTGDFAIGDYTDDGKLDVLIPMSVGMLAFESSTGVPEPVAFPAVTTSTVTHLRGSPNPLAVSALAGVANMVRLDYDMADARVHLTSNDGAAVLDSPTPCGQTITPIDPTHPGITGSIVLRGRGLDPYIDVNRLRVPFVVVDHTGHAYVCIDTPGASTGSLYFGPLSALAQGATMVDLGTPSTDGETFFADLDHNPATCPDLLVPIVSSKGEATIVVPNTGAPGTCSVDPTKAFIATIAAGAATIGIPLAAAELDLATNKTGIVTSLGVYTLDTVPAKQVAVATRSWRYAAVTDLDGDGVDDVVTTGLAEDVEVFLQLAGNLTPEFRYVRIPTDASIYQVALGDFDGDGVGDVAMVGLDTTTVRAGTIGVSYATPPAAFGAPIIAAALPSFYYLTSENIVDPTLPGAYDDQADDLIAAHGADAPATDTAKLTYLYGSGTREMTAPWVTPTAPYATAWAVATGRFGSDGGAGAVAMFANGNSTTTNPNNVEVVDVTRTVDSLDSNPAAPAPFANCTGSTFCVRNGRYVTWSRSDGAGGDLLFGLRNDVPSPATACAGYYTLATPTLATELCSTLGVADPTTIIGIDHARIVESDDNSATLLTAKSTSALLWALTSANGVPALALVTDLSMDLTAFTGATTVVCQDAAAAELGTRVVDGITYGAGIDLVAACHVTNHATTTTQLFARYAAADGSAPDYELLQDLGVDLRKGGINVRAGDINGDGLDDIIYTTGTTGQGTVHVRLQCDTHDSSCKQGGG